MIWLTWRQHRVELIITVLLLVILCILFIHDGLAAYSVYRTINLATCLPMNSCNVLFAYGPSWLLASYLPWLAFLIGVFVGAPLVARERELHTHYLVWSQSITRTRWLAIKLALIVPITLLAFIVLTIVTTWWSEPINATISPWFLYTIRGFVLPASALFGLMLGVAIGTVMNRTVPAMALTFVVFFLISLLLNTIYPYLVPPISKLYPVSITSGGLAWGRPGDLTLYAGYADQQGHETGEISTYCGFKGTPADPSYGPQANKCIKERNLQWKIVYQPPERFWTLQAVEAAILVLLALALLPFTFWWLRTKVQ